MLDAALPCKQWRACAMARPLVHTHTHTRTRTLKTFTQFAHIWNKHRLLGFIYFRFLLGARVTQSSLKYLEFWHETFTLKNLIGDSNKVGRGETIFFPSNTIAQSFKCFCFAYTHSHTHAHNEQGKQLPKNPGETSSSGFSGTSSHNTTADCVAIQTRARHTNTPVLS